MINSWMGIVGPVKTWDSVVNQRQRGVCLWLQSAWILQRWFPVMVKQICSSRHGKSANDNHGQTRGSFTCNLKDH